MTVAFRPSTDADLDWIAELRAVVLRGDLERLGRFDPVRVRQRLRDGFDAANTRIIVFDGSDIGSITVRREPDARWLEHFYILPEMQGRGVGSRVLELVLAEQDATPLRLNVLRGSGARSLYERHGFDVDTEDDVDVFMTHRGVDTARPAGLLDASPGLQLVLRQKL